MWHFVLLNILQGHSEHMELAAMAGHPETSRLVQLQRSFQERLAVSTHQPLDLHWGACPYEHVCVDA